MQDQLISLEKSGRKKRITELIKNTLGITINEEEVLSSKVCRKCQDLLKTFDDFRTMVLDTQATVISEGSTKRSFKSPLPAEPGKRSRTDDSVNSSNLRPRLSTTSKRLEFNLNGTSSREQPTFG